MRPLVIWLLIMLIFWTFNDFSNPYKKTSMNIDFCIKNITFFKLPYLSYSQLIKWSFDKYDGNIVMQLMIWRLFAKWKNNISSIVYFGCDDMVSARNTFNTLLDKILVHFGNNVYLQVEGIPVVNKCAPSLIHYDS